MSKLEKQIERLRSIPKDYTYSEAKALAQQFGYVEKQKGRTSGSRVLLFRESDERKSCFISPIREIS